MIINKVEPYWTEEEREQLEALLDEQQHFANEFGRKRAAGEIPVNELTNEEEETFDRIDTEITQLETKVKNRYREDRKPKGLLEDVEEIVAAIEKEDFLESISYQNEQLKRLREAGVEEKLLAILKNHSADNYENCYSFVIFNIKNQLVGLKGKAFDKTYELVEKRVSQWYVKPTPAYFRMAHGKATDALGYMTKKDAVADPITRSLHIKKYGVELVIDDEKVNLFPNTDKIFSKSIIAFTDQNDFRNIKKNNKAPDREIIFSLKDYAKELGYDVDIHETSTPEEAKKEKLRAKRQLDNARRAIKKELDTLHKLTLKWQERIGGKTRDFTRVSIVTLTEIKNGQIRVAFTPEIAAYLAERNLITQYPAKLFGISGNQPTAYYIGKKLAEYYNIDNNQIKGTHDRIGIPSILAISNLTSYEDLQASKDRGHWEERIKEPLMNALDILKHEGVLKDWEFTHAKGVPLTDEEAGMITSYEDFEKLYLHFVMADEVDHTERIKEKQKRREEQREKQKQRKKNQTQKKEGGDK